MKKLPSLPDLLLKKAAEDEAALDALLGNSKIADSVIGFHAQQAAEKLTKAVLAHNQIEYPKTHNLSGLIVLLNNNNISFPPKLTIIDELTPFATNLRYDDFDNDHLDRQQTKELIKELRLWAERQITD